MANPHKTLGSWLNNQTSDQARLYTYWIKLIKYDVFYKIIIIYGQPPFKSEVLVLLYTLGNTGTPDSGMQRIFWDLGKSV